MTDQEALKQQVERLRNRSLDLSQEKARIDTAIKSLQDVCEHNMECTGRHDSHKDEYECKWCGKVELI